MHPLDYAMQIEQNGKEFYLKQAGLTEDSAFREIFEGLARDEEQHYQLLKQIKESGIYDYSGSTFVPRDTKIFGEPVNNSNYIAIYQQAVEFEEQSIDLYSDLAHQAISEQEKQTFMMLVREEEGHRNLLRRVLELLQRPEEWYPHL